ncbi:MAG: SAM-dependent methyltransferase [Candidatus Endobugula sp.]|jgi:SAM-dependent methyltransferase
MLKKSCFTKRWLQSKYYLLKKHYGQRFGLGSLAVSRTHIVNWFLSPLGQRVLSEEQKIIDALLLKMFGYHLMQLSVLPSVPLFSNTVTGHQFMVEPVSSIALALVDKSMLSVNAHFEYLPIDADVIDVAIVHHALDFSTHPHQLLREATRTLIPNGHIILVGFNPFSLLGLGHSIARLLSRSYIYRRQRLPVSRLKDWFEVLDLELVYSQQGYHGLPLHRYDSARLNRILKWVLPFWGGFYVLVLRKNIASMTMLQSKWKRKSVLPVWQKSVVTQSSHTNNNHTHTNDNSHHQKLATPPRDNNTQ